MVKGHLRPPIDIKAARNMLEKNDRAPRIRLVEDKQLNNGTPKFIVSEYKQMYIAIGGSMTMEPPLLIANFVIKKPGALPTYIATGIWGISWNGLIPGLRNGMIRPHWKKLESRTLA